MTPKQRSYQISLLRALHLSPRYKNLYADDKVAYRHFLKEQLGVESSKELKLGVLKELVEYFEFKRDEPPTNKASNQQVGYLKHLWSKNATNKDFKSLLTLLQNKVNVHLKSISDLTPNQCKQAIGIVSKLEPVAYANNPNYKGEPNV
jgi:hypothetical protein